MAGRAAGAASAARRRAAQQGPTQSASSAGDNGEGLRAYLLGQWRPGDMTAKAVCALVYHVTAAGAKE
eukprot:6371801-Alexandrium_andersonii.AAC.1